MTFLSKLWHIDLPYDEIEILNKFLEMYREMDDYEVEKQHTCLSLGGVCRKFLSAKDLRPAEYLNGLRSFTPSLIRYKCLDFLISYRLWNDILQEVNRKDIIKRIEYIVDNGVPLKMVIYGDNPHTLYKISKKICKS